MSHPGKAGSVEERHHACARADRQDHTPRCNIFASVRQNGSGGLPVSAAFRSAFERGREVVGRDLFGDRAQRRRGGRAEQALDPGVRIDPQGDAVTELVAARGGERGVLRSLVARVRAARRGRPKQAAARRGSTPRRRGRGGAPTPAASARARFQGSGCATTLRRSKVNGRCTRTTCLARRTRPAFGGRS